VFLLPVDPGVSGPAFMAVTQSLSLFQSFTPSFVEIKNGDVSDPAFVTDVRMGELAAATLTLGIGAIASSFTGSAIPMGVSTLMAFTLIVLYESALRYEGPKNA
jgi:hypothetical protein